MIIMLVEKIKSDIVSAMKSKDKEKLSTLRMLLAKIEKEKISLKLSDLSDLTDQQVESVVSSAIKELNKEIESYVAVGRTTESQEVEKEVLLSYLPKQLTEEEIKLEVVNAVLSLDGGIGDIMKHLSSALQGKADMKLVSQL